MQVQLSCGLWHWYLKYWHILCLQEKYIGRFYPVCICSLLFLYWIWYVLLLALSFGKKQIISNQPVKKTKAIATVVAVIALLIGGLASYEWNPISEEEQEAAIAAISSEVYWAPFGKVYHTPTGEVDENGDEIFCSSLNRSETLSHGTVEQAIAAGRTRLCSFCAKRDDIDTTGVKTDEQVVDEEDVEETEEDTTDDTAEE